MECRAVDIKSLSAGSSWRVKSGVSRWLLFNDAGTAATVISGRAMTDDEYQTTLEKWQCERSAFMYLKMSCALAESPTGREARRCICARFQRSQNQSCGASTRNITKGVDMECTWRKIDYSTRESLPKLVKGTFEGFREVLVIDISAVGLSAQ